MAIICINIIKETYQIVAFLLSSVVETFLCRRGSHSMSVVIISAISLAFSK